MTGKKTLEEIAERLKLRPSTVAEVIVTAKRKWTR
jgi:DNA-binding CsgD family transcriptional regulator